MTNISHVELEKLTGTELENILFSCKTILNQRALEQFELDKKSKEQVAYKNTMRYYKGVSNNYAKNLLLIGPYSWYFRTISHYEWMYYQEKFEQYIRSNYLEVEELVRPPYLDYSE